MTITAEEKPVPAAGEVYWVDFDPVRGTEQGGPRPALVISPRSLHQRTRRAIVCPITSNTKPWPTNVPLPEGLAVSGAVLVDQVRSVDRTVRGFRFAGRVPDDIVRQVRGTLAALVGIDLAAVGSGSEGDVT